MRRLSQRIVPALAGIALLMQLGCGSKVLVPPRIDLRSFGTLGMIEFSSKPNARLQEQVTQDFMQTMQSAQSGARILELGPEARVLRSIERQELDLEAIKAIGEKYGVDTLLTGTLELTEVKPSLNISRSLTSVNVRAEVQGTLSVKVFETKSGATLWTSGARGDRAVARASIVSNGPYRVGASDPESAYSQLVQNLVYQATHDFRSHWVKQ